MGVSFVIAGFFSFVTLCEGKVFFRWSSSLIIFSLSLSLSSSLASNSAIVRESGTLVFENGDFGVKADEVMHIPLDIAWAVEFIIRNTADSSDNAGSVGSMS